MLSDTQAFRRLRRGLFATASITFAALTGTPASSAPAVTWEALHEPGCGGWMTGIAVSPHDHDRVLLTGDMLGIGLSTDRGDSWAWAQGLEAWEIADVTWSAEDPERVWSGSMSGPLLSTDGGASWSLQREGFPPIASGTYSTPIEVVLAAPGDASRLVALGGSSRGWAAPSGTGVEPQWGAVWLSTDAGANWSRLSTVTPEGGGPGERSGGSNISGGAFAAGSADRLFVVGNAFGVAESVDGGENWTLRNRGLPHTTVARVETHPTDPDTLWVSLLSKQLPDGGEVRCGGVFKSTDGGTSWSPINDGLSQHTGKDRNHAASYKGFAVSPTDPDVMVVSDVSWNKGAVYTSHDGGESWRAAATRANLGREERADFGGAYIIETAYFSGAAMTELTIDPRDPDVMFGIGSEYVLRTVDGGETWDDATAERSGSGWRGRGYSGLCSVDFVFNPDEPGESLLLAMDAGKLWRSDDDLQSWTYHGLEPWPWGGGRDAVFAGDHRYATYGQHGSFSGIGVSTDGGETWKTVHGEEHGLPEAPGKGEAAGIYASATNPDVVYATVSGTLYRSEDAGENWTVHNEELKLHWLAGDPTRPGVFFADSDRGVFVCEDGENFEPIGSLGGHRGRLRVDALGRVYKCVWRGDADTAGLWRYADGEWTRLLDERYTCDVAFDVQDPTRLAITTNDDPYHDVSHASGVWVSSDDGKSWSQQNTGLPMTRGQCIAIDPHDGTRIVFGSFGSGYFVGDWPRDGGIAGTRSYASKPDDLVVATSGDPSGPPPLITNGDMSRGDEAPKGWAHRWTGKGELKVSRDTDTYASSPAALRIESVGGSAKGQGGQMIGLKARTSLSIAGSLKSEGDVKINAYAQFFDKDWSPVAFEQLAYAQNRSDWQEFAETIQVPATAVRVSVGLLLEGDGKAWLDDVREVAEEAATAATDAPEASEDTWIKNGSMALGVDVPTKWDHRWTGQGELKVSRDTDTHKSGPASLRLESVGGAAKGLTGQMLSTKGRKTISIAGSVKSEGDVKVNAFAQFFDADWKPVSFEQLGYVQNDQDWKDFSTELEVPGNAVRFNLGILLEGDGRAWLDNVRDASEETADGGAAIESAGVHRAHDPGWISEDATASASASDAWSRPSAASNAAPAPLPVRRSMTVPAS